MWEGLKSMDGFKIIKKPGLTKIRVNKMQLLILFYSNSVPPSISAGSSAAGIIL